MVKPDNYILVYGWMVTELGLKGNELFLYAIIYGFSQDGETEFSGSLRYMQEWLGVNSKATVQNTLEKLMARGLIKKRTVVEKGVTRNFFSAVGRVYQNSRGEGNGMNCTVKQRRTAWILLVGLRNACPYDS